MNLTSSQKKLLLQPVHCTGYLSKTRSKYWLEHNIIDNRWYFRKNFGNISCAGVATENPISWKHNKKYDFKETKFSGVIVKIEKLFLSTTLGVRKNQNDNNRLELNVYDYTPEKGDGCSVIAATVYFRNNCKRIVPLDCIMEAEEFSGGKATRKLMDNLIKLTEDDFGENTISLNDNGSIEIENTYYSLNSETSELQKLKRYLLLDIRKRSATIKAETGNNWFYISDKEYEQIMEIMNSQMKDECGFVPDLTYGETNFDRLVNFASYPFAPELNEFSFLFSHGQLEKIEKELKFSTDGVKRFIKYCGLPYTPKINKLFLQGPRTFCEYLGIWEAGFRDEKAIETLMDTDTRLFFSKCIKDCFVMYYVFKGNNKNSEIGLYFFNYNYRYNPLYNDIKLLFKIYDENSVAKLVSDQMKNSGREDYYVKNDILLYMNALYEQNYLPRDIIRKIGKEGFTKYNHDILMRLYTDTHPRHEAGESHYENKEISYTDEEMNLEWENSGYKFCLPENTNRLVDIGAKMNICVGHLYRDEAVNKECTIIYAKKNDEYKLCIEVSTHNELFQVVQISGFNNNPPRGNDMKIFTQWCRIKGIYSSQ